MDSAQKQRLPGTYSGTATVSDTLWRPDGVRDYFSRLQENAEHGLRGPQVEYLKHPYIHRGSSRWQATVGTAEQAFELEAVGGMEDDELANLGAFSLTHAGVQSDWGPGCGESLGRFR